MDEIDVNGNDNGANGNKAGIEKETNPEKKARLNKETTKKVEHIEKKAEEEASMYTVYQFFMAASVLSAILGVVCVGLLIYYYVNQNKMNDEQRPLVNQGGQPQYYDDGYGGGGQNVGHQQFQY